MEVCQHSEARNVSLGVRATSHWGPGAERVPLCANPPILALREETVAMNYQRKGFTVALISVAIAASAADKWAALIAGVLAVVIVVAALVLAFRSGVYPTIRVGSAVLGWWQPDCRGRCRPPPQQSTFPGEDLAARSSIMLDPLTGPITSWESAGLSRGGPSPEGSWSI